MQQHGTGTMAIHGTITCVQAVAMQEKGSAQRNRVAMLQERQAAAKVRWSEASATLERARHDFAEAEAELAMVEKELLRAEQASTRSAASNSLSHVSLRQLGGAFEHPASERLAPSVVAIGSIDTDDGSSDVSSVAKLERKTAGSYQADSHEPHAAMKLVKTVSQIFNFN